MDETQKPRKKRDTSQKRRAILEGAIAVFTKYGFEASSMDHIADVAGVAKRTIYNHFPSKEVLFEEIVRDFLQQRDKIKPISYDATQPLADQLKDFARAELFLINDPVRRSLSKLLTSVFLMDVRFGKSTRGQFSPYSAFLQWLQSAKEDNKIAFSSPELAARVFYGMVEGCLTYPALFTDGENLKSSEPLLDELIATYLARYGVAGEVASDA